MLTLNHLRIIQALSQQGTLTEAANMMCMTQSALSHQIRHLEQKLELTLWQREGRGLRLTQAGQYLLQTAQQVLPVIEQSEKMLQAYAQGQAGIIRVGVECYPCYEWLTRVIADYLMQMPDMDIEVITKFQFSGMEGLLNRHIDLLVTPDREAHPGIVHDELYQYPLVLLSAESLSEKNYLEPCDLQSQTLLVFPVPLQRLDIFNDFLQPAGIRPRQIKTIESVELMVQMVAIKRGVCVLPQWLAEKYQHQFERQLYLYQLGPAGIRKHLYASVHESDSHIPYIQGFIKFLQKK